MILAHGLGGRADLPIPGWMAVTGAGLAVAFSFVVAYAYWYDPVLFGKGGAKLPARAQRFLRSPSWTWFWKVIGLLAAALFFAAAWFGSSEQPMNPAPTWLYVWLWVGLVPASLAFGPVWKAISPLRTISQFIGRSVTPKRLPTHWGYWPATISLTIFLWLELVANKWSVEPRYVALFATIYSVVQIAFGVYYGPDWFERGDGFEAYSNTLARLAVIGRRNDGEIVLRNPLDGLASLPKHKSFAPFVCLLLGSTAFDGLTRQSAWKAATLGIPTLQNLVAGTIGLLVAVLAVFLLFQFAMAATRWLVPTTEKLPQEFAHTLVPIAIGYTVAHYFSFALFEGQNGFLLAADPFNTGANWLGIQDWGFFQQPDGSAGVNLLFLSSGFIAWAQVVAVVLGHFVGVMCAHDRALRLLKPKETVGQMPMLLAMIFFTCMGIYLLLGR
jgi:hypothetical protein